MSTNTEVIADRARHDDRRQVQRIIRKAVEDLERREREREPVIVELNREIEVGGRRADAG